MHNARSIAGKREHGFRDRKTRKEDRGRGGQKKDDIFGNGETMESVEHLRTDSTKG